MTSLARLARSQLLALIALIVALSGTAYAVQTAPRNSVTSASIVDGAVHAPDIAANAVNSSKVGPNALTGGDVNEATLGRVPAAVRANLGGLVWASPVGSCTPTNTAYTTCTQASFTMPASGHLVLIGQLGISHRNDNQYQAAGVCRYAVNGATTGTSFYPSKAAGTLANGYEEARPLIDTFNAPAGAVTVTLSCQDIYYSKFTSVRFVAMASS